MQYHYRSGSGGVSVASIYCLLRCSYHFTRYFRGNWKRRNILTTMISWRMDAFTNQFRRKYDATQWHVRLSASFGFQINRIQDTNNIAMKRIVNKRETNGTFKAIVVRIGHKSTTEWKWSQTTHRSFRLFADAKTHHKVHMTNWLHHGTEIARIRSVIMSNYAWPRHSSCVAPKSISNSDNSRPTVQLFTQSHVLSIGNLVNCAAMHEHSAKRESENWNPIE